MIRELDRHRDLLRIMVERNLKIRYKRSVLGFFWTLLNPLFFILIYTIFLKILKFYKAGDPLFLPMLVTGVITWQFLSMCLNDSLHTVLGHANLVAKASFPRAVLPLSMCVANFVNFLLSLLILLAYTVVLRAGHVAPVHFHYLPLLPLTLLTHFAFCVGLSMVLAALHVFFRDTEHILAVGLLAWFFLTPVIYYLHDIPPEYQRMAFLNPMTGIITAYRSSFLGVELMAPRLVLLSFGAAWLVGAAGMAFFARVEDKFVDAL